MSNIEDDYRDDLEESPADLEADDSPSLIEEHQKVLSSAIDYSLEDLAGQVVDGDLDLQPEYQRRHRWSNERKSRLIESLLMNIPLPPVFLSQEGDTHAVIDGKQRLTAIAQFILGDLKLEGLTHYTHLNGHTLADLDTADQKFLKKRIRLRGVIILEGSPHHIRLQTFQRLNTGGVQLNAQEIRNIAFRGPLNDLIMRLSTDSEYHRLLRITDLSTSRMHQEMRDAEFVLRFLAFKDDWKSFDGSIKGHMDKFMERNRKIPISELESLEQDFHRVVGVIHAAYGDRAFARWSRERNSWRSQVVAALLDAQMLGCQKFSVDEVVNHRDAILDAQKKLFSTVKFREATESATNARTAFVYRIGAVERAVRRAAS